MLAEKKGGSEKGDSTKAGPSYVDLDNDSDATAASEASEAELSLGAGRRY